MPLLSASFETSTQWSELLEINKLTAQPDILITNIDLLVHMHSSDVTSISDYKLQAKSEFCLAHCSDTKFNS